MVQRKYGSNIPQARERLALLALTMRDAGHIEWSSTICDIICCDMRQTPPDKITRVRNNSPNMVQVQQVRMLRATTDMSQAEIAHHVGLNAGRVSEIIHDTGEPNDDMLDE